jgi:hypothetical protein
MITKIIHTNTREPVANILLREYAAYETIVVKNLHNQECETFIRRVLDIYKDSSENLVLLVVRFIIPENRPKWIAKKLWESYKEYNKNCWGFKVLNPKLYNRKCTL